MKITILGSGFGLYGYLPALLAYNFSVLLPIRYQSLINNRSDLQHLAQHVTWHRDEDACLRQCDAVLIALPPNQQEKMVQVCLSYENIHHYLLEKPLAATPHRSSQLLERLIISKKKFRIGYNFRYTQWGKRALEDAQGLASVDWRFHAHHYRTNQQTWKRLHEEGGGALRFYGIHLIALLAEMGYHDVQFSTIQTSLQAEAESWQAVLIGADVSPCHLSVQTNVESIHFCINQTHKITDPFAEETPRTPREDPRVPILIRGLSDCFDADIQFYPWYTKTVSLWQKIEALI